MSLNRGRLRSWRCSIRPIALSIAALALTACSLQPPQTDPPQALPEQFSQAGSTIAPALWWQSFDDPQLDALVATALQDNPGLQVIAARMRAAEAFADAAGAPLFPSLSASASHTRAYADAPDSQVHRAGLSASYEVDLWGRVRAQRDAAGWQAQASAEELQAARISLSANVAVLWYQLGSLGERLRRIEAEQQAYRRILQLVEARFRNGQAPVSDVLRQRQLVESTGSLRATAEAELGVTAHALQELLGQPAGSTQLAGKLPSDLPAVAATGVPAQIVNRRPDVRQAWLNVRAADASVAAAIANRFPQLELSSTFTSNDGGMQNLFDDWIGSLVASIAGPIVDGGARRAEVRRTRAVLDQRIAEYRRAVLAAFREVQDALLLDRQLQLRVNSLEEQLRLSDQVVERLERQLRNGSTSYLNLLDAQISNSGLHRDIVVTRQLLAEQRIALFRALAGPLPDSTNNIAESYDQ